MAAAVFVFVVVVATTVAVPSPICESSLDRPKPVGDPRFCSSEGQICFSYNRDSAIGPPRWDNVCQTRKCFNGQNQSPIYIDPCLVEYGCGPTLGYYDNPTVTAELVNEGVSLSLEHIEGVVKLSGVPGFPSKTFDLINIHFHFRGGPNKQGTEHKIRQSDYDAEMHLIHRREDVSTNEQGLTESGLSVVAVFLSTEKGRRSSELDKILNKVDQVREYRLNLCRSGGRDFEDCADCSDNGVCPEMSEPRCLNNECGDVAVTFNPDGLLPRRRDFYYYYGSTTSPPVTEAVSWIIMAEPVRITKHQLLLMQQLESREKGVKIVAHGNVRPTQPLNGRKVFGNFCSFFG